MDGTRLYAGVAAGDEVERLMAEPAAALSEAGVDIGDGPHGHPVTRFSIVRRDVKHIYIIYVTPDGGLYVVTIPLGYAQ